MALPSGRKGVASDQVDYLGKIKGLDIPIASPSKAGTVKPVAKTEAMTQDVGVDSAGRLFTKGGSSPTITELLSVTSITGGVDHNLSDDISKYDLVIFYGKLTVEGNAFHPSSVYVVKEMSKNERYGISTNTASLWMIYKNDTVFTDISTTFTSPLFLKVYGIKF